MSASTLTTVAFIYKRDYSNHQIADITMRDHVWWQKIHKEGGFGGDSFLYPVRYGNPQGVSGTFSKARTNAKGSKGMQLRAYRTPKFGVVTIDGEAALASKGNTKAFYDLVTMETDRVLEEVGDSYAFDFYRDTYGMRGRVVGHHRQRPDALAARGRPELQGGDDDHRGRHRDRRLSSRRLDVRHRGRRGRRQGHRERRHRDHRHDPGERLPVPRG
jgi:hypothetical protein